MNNQSKRLQIIIQEKNHRFTIDITQDVTLTEIFELIYECKYIENYNISEHCGLLQYDQDQNKLIQVIDNRPGKIYNQIENNMVVQFKRGSEFYEERKIFQQQKEQQLKAQQNKTIGSKFDSQIPAKPQNQIDINDSDAQIHKSRKDEIKLISIATKNQGEIQQQQQQQQQQQYQSQSYEQISHQNLQSQIQNQSQYNSQSQKISDSQNPLPSLIKQSNQFTLLKQPITCENEVQLDIIINNIRSTYFIISSQTKEQIIEQLNDLIQNFKQEYSEIMYMNYMNEQIDEKENISKYKYIQAFACSQGYTQQQIQVVIESEKNFFQYRELYQYQIQQSVQDLQLKRIQRLFKEFSPKFTIKEEGTGRGSILIKNHENQILQYQQYFIKQNNRLVGTLQMKIQNQSILQRQLALFLQLPENRLQIERNEILIIKN